MEQSNNHCAHCGTAQEGNLKFIIGAKSDNPDSKDDWCLVEGSGRLVCPECYSAELEHGKAIIAGYIARFNAHAKVI